MRIPRFRPVHTPTSAVSASAVAANPRRQYMSLQPAPGFLNLWAGLWPD
jgi:hypothetical protein